jgi:hypothetical protein
MMYECVIDSQAYKCNLEILSSTQPYELNLTANGSRYHILIGSHHHGNFICIPNWSIGAELAGLTDTFWNLESLSKHLNFTDAHCIANGLSLASRLLD